MGNSRDYAVRLLEALEDQYGHYMTTKGVLLAAGIRESMQAMQLKILHELANVGTIERRKGNGGGLRWKLLTKEWDRNQPTAAVPGQQPAEQQHTEAEPKPERKAGSDDLADLRRRLEIAEGKIEMTEAELAELEDRYQRSNGVVRIKKYDGKVIELKGVVLPKCFSVIKDLAACRRPILLVGPAGCGKTHIGRLLADSLELDFGSISCSSGMSETHLLGRSTPDFTTGKNKYQGTEFLRIYEGGGVFLIDEIDAADSNLLLVINSAIANGYCNVPNRPDNPHAKKHKDFILVVTANTYGRGATRVYAGRNQLDEATLDRFRMGTIEVDYDVVVEEKLCPDEDLRTYFYEVRSKIVATGLRRIVSTRFLEDAYVMLKSASWDIKQISDIFFAGWSDDERGKAYVPPPCDPDEEDVPAKNFMDADPVQLAGSDDWHCPTHGKLIPMKSGKGLKCPKAGTYNTTSKRWSMCNCCKWTPVAGKAS